MEVASLSIGIAGLAGLFSTCLDMVGRWDSYKDFVLESGSIKARFVADRVRFRQWGERVGLDQGKFKDDHHQTLDDPVVRSAVHLILHNIARIDDDVKNLSSYLGDLSHLSSSLPESSLALPSSHTLFEKLAPPRKKRIGWAMRGKTRTLVLVGSFETLVQKLYNLVPPEEQKSKVTAPIVEADSWRDNIQKILVDLEKQIQNETLREILDWLDAPDTRRTYDDCILRRLDGTCDWILHRPEFCRWQSSVSREQKILWIHGPPGYGKTIICARIVEYLSTNSCDNIAHFFFSSELEIRSNPFAVMRSWITQLLPGAQQAFDLIRDKWEATDGRTASKINIKELFDTLIHNLPPCTFVVDGLDECAVANMAGGLDHSRREVD
ncbi:hypothetical protein NUW58_g481 [Xylaria curta]|uniref:Uncharacterized protein n=1 Tax=Xylaria curta TaxID=42375 RepID=A0ACC1PP62_9PEZI|nr:hypothetical protein NUW58_g481 [Xylaria curta]